MGSAGENASFLFSIPTGVDSLSWSPDGRWLTYLRPRPGQMEGAVLEAHLPGPGSATTVFEATDLRGYCWVPPNHIILDRWEAPEQPFSNLWEIDIDLKEMKTRGKARRLTNWAGFAIGSMSASQNGKRLAVTKRQDQSDVLIADLAEHGAGIHHLRRFTSDERIDWPGGWSNDSKWLLFQSDRSGHMGVFRQRVDSPNPEPIVTNQEDNRAPLLSPDGTWVLYFAWRSLAGQMKTGRLMRMPVGGGSPELVLETNGFPGSAQTSNFIFVPTTAGQPAFRCPSQPGASCVLSEAASNEVVFYSFAPVPGTIKSEIFRLKAKDPNFVAWDVSRDGSRIVYSERDYSAASIHIRELGRGTTRDILLPGLVALVSVGWSADGKGVFVTSFAPAGSSLWQVTFDGKYRVLYKGAKEVELPKPSPDGRLLAFGEVVSASNVWLIEGLPQ